MARKDVELVIRAKDQAGKAVDAITAAIEGLVTAQDGLGRSSEKTNSVLGRLGTAVTGLDKALKSVSLSNTLTRELEAANAASARLEKSMADTAGESARLSQELAKAATATAALRQQAGSAEAAVNKQAAALKNARAAQQGLTSELSTATAERDKLTGADARLTTQIGKQEARLEAAREKFARLSQELAATAQPTTTFQNRVTAAGEAVARAEGRLSELQQQAAQTKTSLTSASDTVGRLTTKLEQATKAAQEQKAALAASRAEYQNINQAARAAAAAQKTLDDAASGTQEALQRQQAEFEQSQAVMAEFAARTAAARAAMDALARAARGPMLKALQQQKTTVASLLDSWGQNERAIESLSAEIGRVGVPTRAMVEAFNQLREAARAAKEEANQQRAVYQQLRTELRNTATDTDQLAAKQRLFASAMATGGEAVNRVKTQTTTAASAVTRLNAAAGQAAGAMDNVARKTRDASGATDRASSSTDRLAQAYRRLYGESRTAMSFTQRLRGEILSLIAAHAGFFAVIGVLGQTVSAYQQMEAAASRMNVVFDGDQTKAAQELDFIRRNAERLGIELGSLADQYSQFAVATKGTNLEGENTRKIFISVAEAGRVNKLSLDQMKGVFTALTQIISKGTVQMEELRQQLGDRLPGALQLMADGLGVTTAELIKMTANGEVSADSLIGFADQLDKVFGPQLGAALRTNTAALGQFQNAAFQALLTFGEGGFIESFTRLLQDMTETLKSADFEAFITRLSQAFAFLTDALGLAVQNWQLLAVAMTAVVGIKLLPVFVALVASLRDMYYTAKGAAQAAQTVAAANGAMASTGAAAAGSMGRLGAAMRFLLSSTGIGLLVTVVATGLALWATTADQATDALNRHEKQIDDVKNAYERAGGAVENWQSKLQTFSVSASRSTIAQLQNVYRQQRIQLDQLGKEAIRSINTIELTGLLFNPEEMSRLDQIEQLTNDFNAGRISADKFREALDLIGSTTASDGIVNMVTSMIDLLDASEGVAKKVEEQEAAQRLYNGTASEADLILLGLAEAVEATNAAFDPAKLETYTDAMEVMLGKIPELANELKKLSELREIEEAYNAAIASAQRPGDEVRALSARNQAVQAVLSAADAAVFKEIAQNTKVTKEMFDTIFAEENFRSTAYDDGFGNMTIGYGSTRVNGKPVVAGQTITQDAAMKQAVTDLAGIIAQIEALIKVPLSDQQLIAIADYAYNAGIGSLTRDGIVQALNKGDYAGAQAAIRNGVTTSGGVQVPALAERRNREADMFGEGMQDPAVLAEIVRLQQEQTENAKKYHDQLAANLEQQQFEIEVAKQALIEREQAKAVREAELAAREAGTVLTEQEIADIRARTAAAYAEQAQEEAARQVKEKTAAVEQKVNDLLTQRTELEAQLAIYRETGDQGKITETEEALRLVNEQLQAAIAAAIAMWQAVGGEGADAAIAKLQTANLEAGRFNEKAKQNLLDWKAVGDLFVNGLVNAVDQFAQAVAKGEDVGESARRAFLQFASDFLIEIGKMILKQIIFNALRAVLGGFGIPLPIGHTGGLVGSRSIGSGNGNRTVNPMVFAGAARFHDGGIAGLRPGEVPAILKENEEILTRDDPRHMLNGGAAAGGPGGASPMSVKVVNAIDSGDFLSAGLDTVEGERSILNFMRANRGQIRSIIGS